MNKINNNLVLLLNYLVQKKDKENEKRKIKKTKKEREKIIKTIILFILMDFIVKKKL